MADGGPPVPQPPPVILPVLPTAPYVQLPAPPAQLIAPPTQPIQAPMPQLNWSHFKPEFAGKPNEDVEAHLLRTNDWMNTRGWRSFHFDENTETMDPYITHIRQVATLLGYGKPQVLEVFKNTLQTRLYWVLFH